MNNNKSTIIGAFVLHTKYELYLYKINFYIIE
jgi:hypothetical protein